MTAAAVALAALTAAACGGGSGGTTPEERAASGTLTVGRFPWSASGVTTAVLGEIASRYEELGVRRVEVVEVTPEEGWTQLQDGDLDVLPEVYLPNQYEYFAKARNQTDLVHRTYSGAGNAWYVPAYTVEPGGPAEGLFSIDQLRKYGGVFGRTLFDGEPGWVTTKQNADRIEGFKLGFAHETGTEEELLAELRRRYREREPMLLYLWRPHWAHSAYDLVDLEEPNGYSINCFEGERKACAMPTNDVWIAAREDVKTRFPRLWRFLNRFELPLAEIETMLAQTERRGRPLDEVAREWVDDHATEVAIWVAA